MIRFAQRLTGPTDAPAYFPPSVHNVKLHVVMSDFDNAFNALGGRKQLGGSQINNKKKEIAPDATTSEEGEEEAEPDPHRGRRGLLRNHPPLVISSDEEDEDSSPNSMR
jgi:hypothetical protein